MLTVLVIDESRSRAGEICAGLALAGYQVAAILAGSENLTAEVERLQPDVILIDTDSPSRDTLENLAAMNKDMPRPVVIFTQEDGQETIRDAVKAGVSAYIVDGLDSKRIKPIVEVARARFEDTQALRRELDEISKKLSDRKLVDKAKGRADEGARPRRGCGLPRHAQAGHGTRPVDGQSGARRHRHGAGAALRLCGKSACCTATVHAFRGENPEARQTK